MAQEAEQAGVEIRFGTEFVGAIQNKEAVQLESVNVTCKFLIGADGARSPVAQAFGLSRNTRFLIGAEAEYEGLESLEPDRLHCFVDSALAKGYIAWAAPGVGMTQIGLACRDGLKPDLKTFTQKLHGVFDFSKARLVGHRGGLIPVGGKLKQIAHNRVLLLGDAAGVVSPLTAGGIYPALFTGQFLAEAIYTHLYADGPAPAGLLNGLYPDYTWKSLLRLGLDYAPPNRILENIVFSPPFRAFAQTIFFHHRGLFSPTAWREILKTSLSPA